MYGNNSRVLERPLLATSEAPVLEPAPRAHQPLGAAADGLGGTEVAEGSGLHLRHSVQRQRAGKLCTHVHALRGKGARETAELFVLENSEKASRPVSTKAPMFARPKKPSIFFNTI